MKVEQTSPGAYVAFLRGVSPLNAKMDELRRCFEAAGFRDVRTVLGSGNVVFSADQDSEAQLELTAEQMMQKRLGRVFLTVVRSVPALERLLASDPYQKYELLPGSKRVVTFLKSRTKAKVPLPLEAEGARTLHVRGREVFSAYVPNPKAPVFMTLIEKAFGTEQTTRTWETISKCVRAVNRSR
jgi:uncharacterized protein (DUF1697 family)